MRHLILIGGLTLALFSTYRSYSAGVSRLYSTYAASTDNAAAANASARSGPNDARAHFARAVILQLDGKLIEAIGELEQAVALRPRDYALWMELGRMRDENEDFEGAVEAFEESVRLAPDYARPHWQLGNFLIRSGKIDDGFVNIRHAASSDRVFVQNAIDLAWAIYPGNTNKIEDIVRPNSNSSRMALAHFYMKQGLAHEAMRLYREAGGLSSTEERTLLNELLAGHKFHEAYEVWLNSHKQVVGTTSENTGALIDGGFEGMIGLDDPGFGWLIDRNQQGVKVALDDEFLNSGKRSLRIDWTGNNLSQYVPLQQLILVNPNSTYRLKFFVQTRQVVSGGLPLVIVLDAGSGQLLGQTPHFPSGTTPWNSLTVDFKTLQETQAVSIQLLRQNCSSGPCPMFGNVWVDDFELQSF